MDEKKSANPALDDPLAWRLSALADGELPPDEIAMACRQWRDDERSREVWHAYALIGDALRSEDLAGSAQRDRAFLKGLRQRLAQEPVVLAPRPEPGKRQAPARVADSALASAAMPQAATRRARWAAPMAMAAGVLTVIGVTSVMRSVGDAPTLPAQMAAASTAATPTLADARFGQVDEPRRLPDLANAPVVRNSDIDRYLNAHRQFAGSPVLASPGGLRQVATTPDER